MAIAESDAPVAEDQEYGSMAADPQITWDVGPGLQFESANAYITEYLERTTSNIPDPYDPQSLNRYAYARNNPLKYIDPNGNAHLEYGLDDQGNSNGGFGGLGIGNPGSYGGVTDLASAAHDWGRDGFLDKQLRELAVDTSFEYKLAAVAIEIIGAIGVVGKIGKWGKGQIKDLLKKTFNKKPTKRTNYKPTQSAERMDMKKVDKYADDMKNGNWNWDKMKDKIIIDSEGNIANGHHRVLAAEKAGISIPESAIIRLPGKTLRPVYSWDGILQ